MNTKTVSSGHWERRGPDRNADCLCGGIEAARRGLPRFDIVCPHCDGYSVWMVDDDDQEANPFKKEDR